MINREQQKEILKYLRWKNLAEDMQIEVFDHMMSQIEEKIQSGKNFDDAFEEIKIIWKKELDNEWLDYYKAPKIQKDKVNRIRISLFKKSLAIALIFSVITLFSMKNSDKEIFVPTYEYFLYFTMIFPPSFAIIFSMKVMKTLPLKRNIIATENLLTPILPLFIGICSLQIRNVECIGDVFDEVQQNNISEVLVFLLMMAVHYILGVYIILATIKMNRDIKLYQSKI